MKELLTYLAQNLVRDPAQVQVDEEQVEDRTVLKLHVAQEDMGRIIGKGGKTAKAIRTLVSAAAAKAESKVSVDIVDEEQS